MNKTERAELVRHQYDAGATYGRDTANVILKRFPDGFDVPMSRKLRKISDDGLAHVVNALTAAGVSKQYIKSFKLGFLTGLRNTFIEHVARLSARASGTTQNG